MAGTNNCWWLKPHTLGVFFVAPLFIFVVTSYKSTTVISFLSTDYILIGLTFILTFSLFAYIGSKLTAGRFSLLGNTNINCIRFVGEHLVIRYGYLDFLAIVSILAYIIWFHTLLLHPGLLLDTLKTGTGFESGIRGTVSTISGVTTFTQLGVIYVIAYFGMRKIWNVSFPSIRYRVYCYFIIILAVIRMIAWTERLALLEILVPIALVWLSFTTFRKRYLFMRLVMRFGPYFGLLLLFGFFAFTEYFRSWGAYYRFQSTDGFFPFIANRLFTYYSSSLNNGAGLLATSHWPDGNMTFLLSWFYNFPGVGHFFTDPAMFNPTLQFLNTYGNPQFNTTAGLYAVIFDLGLVGGLAGSAVWGIITGGLYRLFVLKRPVGILLYPVFYVSILEMLRELYLTETRMFPIIVFSLLGAWMFIIPANQYAGTIERKTKPQSLQQYQLRKVRKKVRA